MGVGAGPGLALDLGDWGSSLMICKTRLSITGAGLPVRLSGSNAPSSSTRLLDESDEDPDPPNRGVALPVETTDNERGPVEDWDVD